MSIDEQKLICIVDDDDDVRDSLQALLDSWGYLTRAYSSANEFLRSQKAEHHHCLLLDLNMPGKSGLELLELLRARGVWTPAIILTANGEKLDAHVAPGGIIQCLRKPVAEQELLHWMAKACGGSSASL